MTNPNSLLAPIDAGNVIADASELTPEMKRELGSLAVFLTGVEAASKLGIDLDEIAEASHDADKANSNDFDKATPERGAN